MVPTMTRVFCCKILAFQLSLHIKCRHYMYFPNEHSPKEHFSNIHSPTFTDSQPVHRVIHVCSVCDRGMTLCRSGNVYNSMLWSELVSIRYNAVRIASSLYYVAFLSFVRFRTVEYVHGKIMLLKFLPFWGMSELGLFFFSFEK